MIILQFTDTENPKVSTCPTSFEVRLSPGERNRLIFWQEPTFTDNVGVERVYKTRVSKRHRIRPNNPRCFQPFPPKFPLENFPSRCLISRRWRPSLPLLLYFFLYFRPFTPSFRSILQGIRIFTPFLFPSPKSLFLSDLLKLSPLTIKLILRLSIWCSNFLLSLTLCTWRFFSLQELIIRSQRKERR